MGTLLLAYILVIVNCMHIWEKIKKLCWNHRYFLSVILLYFLLRLPFLTILPIFNDEAIYLDWGWRETDAPGLLFYSLYDAKQPLLMWVFGIGQHIFSDPLFAGRLVNVFCGLLSMTGIYLLGKHIWKTSTGIFAAILYAFSPLFAFYDRQALMESAIATIGIWSCFVLLRIIQKPSYKNAFLLGAIFGIGYLIKSTTLIFIVTSLPLLIFFLKKNKQPYTILPVLWAIYLTTIFVDILLFLQPDFWNTLSSNSRFSLTMSELIQFPITIWASNFWGFSQISFFFFTPLVFLGAVIGTIQAWRTQKQNPKIIIAWIVTSIFLQIFLTRNTSVRYLISFLPLLLLFVSYFVMQQSYKLKTILVILISIVPLSLTIFQIINPPGYIFSFARFTNFAPEEYAKGTTTGYGIDTIRNFIDEKSRSQKILVAVAENTGNPESALEIYYEKNPQVTIVYFDKHLLGSIVDQYDCITLNNSLYFISRDDQQAGLDKFLEKIGTISKPYDKSTLGIYTLRKNCKGKVAHLNLRKQ